MGEHNCYKTDVQDCIKKKAYKLWEEDGCKSGRNQDYWLLAEMNVNASIEDDSPKHKT